MPIGEVTAVFSKIKEIFDSQGIVYNIFEHEPVYTSQDAARIRGTNLSSGAKALVLFADANPVLVVVPGDRKADFKKFKQLYGFRNVRMATPDEVLALTGLTIGSIPPVGKSMNIKSYYDAAFEVKDLVAFNAGMHTISIEMTATDLLKVEKPIVGDFSSELNKI